MGAVSNVNLETYANYGTIGIDLANGGFYGDENMDAESESAPTDEEVTD